MADPMTARQAWKIMREGDPSLGMTPDPEWERACAIVKARIDWCEAMDAHFDAPHGKGMKTWIAAQDVLHKARALERGEGKDGGA